MKLSEKEQELLKDWRTFIVFELIGVPFLVVGAIIVDLCIMHVGGILGYILPLPPFAVVIWLGEYLRRVYLRHRASS